MGDVMANWKCELEDLPMLGKATMRILPGH